jgi:hypothetical protein
MSDTTVSAAASQEERFAAHGAALLRLVQRLAVETRGAFPGGHAATALAVAIAVCEAGRNAFWVLGSVEGQDAEDRARRLGAASTFRKALGTIAMTMPGPRGDAEVTSTRGLSAERAEDRTTLPHYFESSPLPHVALEGLAQAALDGLRRDPLVLAAEGEEAVRRLMDAACDGIAVHADEGGVPT